MAKKQRRIRYPKQLPLSTEGNCPLCHKKVKNLEAHFKDVHKGKKIPEKLKNIIKEQKIRRLPSKF